MSMSTIHRPAALRNAVRVLSRVFLFSMLGEYRLPRPVILRSPSASLRIELCDEESKSLDWQQNGLDLQDQDFRPFAEFILSLVERFRACPGVGRG